MIDYFKVKYMMKDLSELDISKEQNSKFDIIPYLNSKTYIELTSANDSKM